MKRPTKFGRARVRLRRTWKSRWFRAILVLAVLGMFAGSGLWAFGKLERRQARGLVAKATEYLKEGKPEEARMGLETALRLDPKNAQALRLLARLREAQGAGAESLDAMRRLADSGQLTLEDLSAYAAAAARAGDWALAERLADAAARGGNPVLRHLLRAELLVSKNDLAGAEAELRSAAEVDKSGMGQVTLARFLITHRLNGETAPEILEMLRTLSARPDQIGAEALGGAISKGLVPRDELPTWIASLRSHPKANPQLLLLADTTEILLAPDSKSAIAKKTSDRLRAAPLRDRAAGLQWLVGLGEPALAVSLLTRDEALESRETLSMWLDALSLQNQWAAILETLDQPANPLPKHLQALYKARALAALDRSPESTAAYELAYRESQEKTEDFLETLAYLALAGQAQLFETGLQQNLADPALAEPTLRTLIPAVSRQRDAAKTKRVYDLAAGVPSLADNTALQNDRDYLALLLGQPVDHEKISTRTEANPRDFSFRLTAALDLLQTGRGKEALELLENCEPDVHVASLAPHQKAVVAASLAASGRRKEALQVTSLVNPQALSVQEIALLQTHLAPEQETPAAPEKTKTPAKKKKSQ
jgi:tetratricopeptide (TPR) repeat protein